MSNGNYILVDKDFTTYYRLAAIGSDTVPEGEGWDVDNTTWHKVVTVEWTIATATSVNISISTNQASYFNNLHNSPTDGGTKSWDVYNEDLGDISLPVELSSFTASADDTKVTLKWETGNEIENIGFYVYRGETADGPFKKISKLIDGAGNLAMGHTYEYIDRKIEPNKTYFYYLEYVDIHGIRDKSNIIQATEAKSDIIQVTVRLPKPPKEYKLFQNYPNPFNPETWIPFQLPKAGEVTIQIYSVTGQLVKTIELGDKRAGMYIDKSKAAYWDGRNNMGEKLASGPYFYELQAETFRSIRKMILLK
ncbi:T9SS type A sorting domain-containing protein [Candidatus Poribacteria bacterium]|nr:T9SS type A sorting domain-containing protein [Candidatus Poribacteria bacterium]